VCYAKYQSISKDKGEPHPRPLSLKARIMILAFKERGEEHEKEHIKWPG
jgi:hypothetical protein